MKINIKDITCADDIKHFFMQSKNSIKYTNEVIERPQQHALYVTGKNEYYCDKTGETIVIHGIGEHKIRIWNYWYTWERLYTAVHQDYKKNSRTLNTFFCIFVEGYQYHHYSEDTVEQLIKNRRYTTYLTKAELPAYIPTGFIKRVADLQDLPILTKKCNY